MRIVKLLAGPAMAAAVWLTSPLAAQASLLININKSTQTMTVSQDGARLYSWPVSTGISAYDTPSGSFTPFRMEKDHFSKEWDDAPMPNSIFFTKRGHAIHGTNHTSIGRPASHGCVRLSVPHAATLFALVNSVGMTNTKVVLQGEIPEAAPAVARAPRAITPRYLQPPAAQAQDPAAEDEYPPQPAPSRFGYQQPRSGGYWLYPDGRRVYVDRDPRLGPPPEPQPQPLVGGPGWR